MGRKSYCTGSSDYIKWCNEILKTISIASGKFEIIYSDGCLHFWLFVLEMKIEMKCKFCTTTWNQCEFDGNDDIRWEQDSLSILVVYDVWIEGNILEMAKHQPQVIARKSAEQTNVWVNEMMLRQYQIAMAQYRFWFYSLRSDWIQVLCL